jgi:hypothetical protein
MLFAGLPVSHRKPPGYPKRDEAKQQRRHPTTIRNPTQHLIRMPNRDPDVRLFDTQTALLCAVRLVTEVLTDCSIARQPTMRATEI